MRNVSKTMPLTAGVKNYLLQCVAKAGTKPERILSEMQLCEKFGVSRITVRRDSISRANQASDPSAWAAGRLHQSGTGDGGSFYCGRPLS